MSQNDNKRKWAWGESDFYVVEYEMRFKFVLLFFILFSIATKKKSNNKKKIKPQKQNPTSFQF